MELLVYKASAGSGKTFTLTVEYIKHLIRNPRAYRQILAVTFTNKATTEMKERILQQLYGIWKGDPKSEPYLKSLDNLLSDSESLSTADIRRRAGQALLLMLHDYSHFSVETIDSFFQSVMRNLARELELGPNLNIELENKRVMGDAVDSMMEKLTPDSPVLAWLLDYIGERISEDKRWNVSAEIKKFGLNIFDESYIERGKGLRQALRHPDTLKEYRKRLRDMETEAVEQMKGFCDQFEGELESRGLTPDDLKNGSRGIGSYFRKLRDGRLTDDDVLNATLTKCLNHADEWAAKTSPNRKEIVQIAEASLMPLLQEAERMRPSRCRTVNSCRLSLRHLNNLQLLNHIDEEVRTLNRERGRFLLSDTNALLHALVREDDSSFVFEKTGSNIRNVMIDEFQDTSRMQWDNFRLLLLEGLSQGADSLIVGDVKQSIYRWRNGDWQILNNLGSSRKSEDRKFPIRVESLKTNRRSETRIVGFNNALFTAATDYLNRRHLDELNEECLPLKRAYADVVQESSRNDEHGYVKVSLLQPDEEHDYTEQTLTALGEAVGRLLSEGVRPDDIAILVRKNKNIPLIADYFEHALHLSVVSDEAFRFDASPAVGMLIDALRCLTCPDDKIAEASLLLALPDRRLPEEFATRRDTLRLLPLYELIETLCNLLQANRMEKQEAYLFAFFDAVTDYLTDHPSDPEAFLRYWDETLSAKTIPGGEPEGIRICSIHKSKGLEFHTVLVPFCDWKLENETKDQLVWCMPDVPPYDGLPLVPVSYSAQMAESVYRKDYLHERLQLWVDNLNLLYVAFTRAAGNLMVWSRKEQKGTLSELLRHTLPRVAESGTGRWDEETSTYECGTLWKRENEERETETSTFRFPLPTFRYANRFRQSNRSADFTAGIDEATSDRRFIDRGRLLHTLFADIATEADIDTAVSRLLFDGLIDSREAEEEVRRLTRRALSQPEVRDWYSGTWRIFAECDIIWRQNGELCTRRPDRVMMRGDEIVVVDFKFGKPRSRYYDQVRGYVDLLIRMGYPQNHIRAYLWYVDDCRVEAV